VLVVRSVVGCNPGEGILGVMLIEVTCVGPGAVRELIWCNEGEYIGSSLAYLVVGGSEGREYWT
jgi:hypothetical protein